MEATRFSALETARRNRFGRVIFEDAPRSTEYLAAREEVEEIRSSLSALRSRLRDVGDFETEFPRDSIAISGAGALDCLIVALYSLVEGDRSFARRAERSDELWADIESNPTGYVLRPGTGRKDGS